MSTYRSPMPLFLTALLALPGACANVDDLPAATGVDGGTARELTHTWTFEDTRGRVYDVVLELGEPAHTGIARVSGADVEYTVQVDDVLDTMQYRSTFLAPDGARRDTGLDIYLAAVKAPSLEMELQPAYPFHEEPTFSLVRSLQARALAHTELEAFVTANLIAFRELVSEEDAWDGSNTTLMGPGALAIGVIEEPVEEVPACDGTQVLGDDASLVRFEADLFGSVNVRADIGKAEVTSKCRGKSPVAKSAGKMEATKHEKKHALCAEGKWNQSFQLYAGIFAGTDNLTGGECGATGTGADDEIALVAGHVSGYGVTVDIGVGVSKFDLGCDSAKCSKVEGLRIYCARDNDTAAPAPNPRAPTLVDYDGAAALPGDGSAVAGGGTYGEPTFDIIKEGMKEVKNSWVIVAGESDRTKCDGWYKNFSELTTATPEGGSASPPPM